MPEILLGTVLRERRKSLGKSQSALAREWKIDQSVLNRWESSKCIPKKPEHLQKITQFLGLSEDDDFKGLFNTKRGSRVAVLERDILPLVQRIVHELGDPVITLSDLQLLAEIEVKAGVPIAADYMKKILDRRHHSDF